MAHPTLKRAAAVLGICVSVVALVLCVAGIVGTWIARQELTAASLDALGAVEQLSASAGAGLERMDGWGDRLRESVQTVQTATAQLSQAIADDGGLSLILPPRIEQEVTAIATAIVDTATTVSETIAAANAVRRSVNRLPFVDVPDPASGPMAPVIGGVQRVLETVLKLSADIRSLRSGVAGALQDASVTAEAVDGLLDEVQAATPVVKAGLVAVQGRVAELRVQLPTTLTWIAVGLTLFFGWVAFSQLVVMQWCLNVLVAVKSAVRL